MTPSHAGHEPEAATPLKIYMVTYAEDIPHYSSTEIEAADDAHALAIAHALDTTDLYYKGSWDSAVCRRIVSIEDAKGAVIAGDIALDHYFLRDGGEAFGGLAVEGLGLLRGAAGGAEAEDLDVEAGEVGCLEQPSQLCLPAYKDRRGVEFAG